MQKQRYYLLDSLRGLALINMIAFHTMWDLVFIYGVSAPWYLGQGAHIWQQAICCTFILLSGFCFSLGRKHFRRGLIVFFAGALVSVVTFVFMPASAILFGVLTCIGSCMLIVALLEKPLKRLHPLFGAVLSFLLFALTRGCNNGYLGFFGIRLLELPEGLYANLLTAFLGFPSPSFTSSDYFSLFPWLFLFILGFYLYELIGNSEKAKAIMSKGRIPVLTFLGKHSLIVYMLHQPLIYGLLMLIM